MIKAEAVKLKAKLGPGEKRQKKQAALVGVCSTVEAQPRAPVALAELVVDPEAAARGSSGKGGGGLAKRPAGPASGQPGADEAGGDGTHQG